MSVVRTRTLIVLAALCLVPALVTKLWVFALFALAALLPRATLEDLGRGVGKHRALALLLALSALAGIISNPQAPPFLRILLRYLGVVYAGSERMDGETGAVASYDRPSYASCPNRSRSVRGPDTRAAFPARPVPSRLDNRRHGDRVGSRAAHPRPE